MLSFFLDKLGPTHYFVVGLMGLLHPVSYLPVILPVECLFCNTVLSVHTIGSNIMLQSEAPVFKVGLHNINFRTIQLCPELCEEYMIIIWSNTSPTKPIIYIPLTRIF